MDEDAVTWVKLDDNFFRNPKARTAGKNGRELYLASCCWSASQLTDGRVPKETLGQLAADAEVPRSTSNRLVAVGLWHDRGDHYEIHDFLKYNRAREDVEAEREASRERMANSRRSSAERAGDVRANNGRSSRAPTRPDPSIEKETRAKPKLGPYESDFNEIWAKYPRKVRRKQALAAYQARRRDGTSASMLATATEHFAIAMRSEGREQQHILHGSTFYGPKDPWEDYLNASAPPSNGADARRCSIHSWPNRCELRGQFWVHEDEL